MNLLRTVAAAAGSVLLATLLPIAAHAYSPPSDPGDSLDSAASGFGETTITETLGWHLGR